MPPEQPHSQEGHKETTSEIRHDMLRLTDSSSEATRRTTRIAGDIPASDIKQAVLKRVDKKKNDTDKVPVNTPSKKKKKKPEREPRSPQKQSFNEEHRKSRPIDSETLMRQIQSIQALVRECSASSGMKKRWCDELDRIPKASAEEQPKLLQKWLTFERLAREEIERRGTFSPVQIARLTYVAIAEAKLGPDALRKLRYAVTAFNIEETAFLRDKDTPGSVRVIGTTERTWLEKSDDRLRTEFQLPVRTALQTCHESEAAAKDTALFVEKAVDQLRAFHAQFLKEAETMREPETTSEMMLRARRQFDHIKQVLDIRPTEDGAKKEEPKLRALPDYYRDSNVRDALYFRRGIADIGRMEKLAVDGEKIYTTLKQSTQDIALRRNIERIWQKNFDRFGISYSIDAFLRAKEDWFDFTSQGLHRQYERMALAHAELKAYSIASGRPPESVDEKFSVVARGTESLLSQGKKQLQERNLPRENIDQLLRKCADTHDLLTPLWLNAGPSTHDRILQMLLRLQIMEQSLRNRWNTLETSSRNTDDALAEAYKKGEKPLPKEEMQKILQEGWQTLRWIDNADENAPLQKFESARQSLDDGLQRINSIVRAVGFSGGKSVNDEALNFHLQACDLQKAFEGSQADWRVQERLLQREVAAKQTTSNSIPHIRAQFPPKQEEQMTLKKMQDFLQAHFTGDTVRLPRSAAEVQSNHVALEAFSSFCHAHMTHLAYFSNNEEERTLENNIRSARSESSSLVMFAERSPNDFECVRSAAQSGEETIRRSLTKSPQVHTDIHSYGDSADGSIIFTIGQGKSDAEPQSFHVYFKRENGRISFVEIPHHVRGTPTVSLLSPENLSAYIRREMSSVPSALTQHAGVMDISQDALKIRTLCAGVSSLDYFEKNADRPWSERFKIASALQKRLQIPLGTFDTQSQFALERLLTLGNLPYADQIVAAIGDGTMNIGYPAKETARHRTAFDLILDHGTLIQVHQRLEQRFTSGQLSKDWNVWRAFIRSEWQRVRRQQWESFGKSEELQPDGTPKTVNVLEISVREFAGSDEGVRASTAQINGGLSRSANSKAPKGDSRRIITEDYATVEAFYSDVRQKLQELSGKGKHVVVAIKMHGSQSSQQSPGQIFLELGGLRGSTQSVGIYGADLFSVLDTVPGSRSTYIWTCHGGSHLKQFAQGFGRNYTPKNVTAFGDNKVVRGGSLWDIVTRAFSKQADGFRAGDFNHDGIVTQSELQEFVNTCPGEPGDDPIIFDAGGHQIGAIYDAQDHETIA